MSDAIDRAAKAMWSAIDDKGIEGRLSREDCDYLAGVLNERGLLAPAPLREEWGIRWDDHDIWDHYLNHDEATVGAGDEGTPVHRWVTEWKEA